MMNATIAHENYVKATTINATKILLAMERARAKDLTKIESLINQNSQEGRSYINLYFRKENSIISFEYAFNNMGIAHGEYSNGNNAYWFHIFSAIREGNTTVNLDLNEQRDRYLNPLREAGYTITSITDGIWQVKWA